MMYSGTVLCDIAHLLLTIICVMRRQRAGCEVLLLPGASPRQVNHSDTRAPPNRNRLGGRWPLDPTCGVQCRGRSPHRFCDHSRVQCALVLLSSSQCLLWLISHSQSANQYRHPAELPSALHIWSVAFSYGG